MKTFLIALTAILFTTASSAQTSQDSIRSVIDDLFKNMREANGEGVQSLFSESAILQTITRRDGKTTVVTEQVKHFADLVNTFKKDSADERIRFASIQIDGPLAAVWTPYQFYFNGSFSHCGVNSFQLVRLDGRWKIQYLIDTRRRQGCQ